jgi:hypothetical protein
VKLVMIIYICFHTGGNGGEVTLANPGSPSPGGGVAELGGGWCDVALPVLAGEHRAATLTPVGCGRGEPR